ncbi:helix-turn-helix domain-containing protein [Citreicella sp. C3M06]|nr:helix-turn-helix domain-containing protein [Citreicella sp. C3M06]
MAQVQTSGTATRRPGFDLWHQSTCREFSTTECELPFNPDFTGAVRAGRTNSLAIGDLTARSGDGHMPLVRRAGDIRRDPRDHIMLYLAIDGQTGLEQEQRAVRVEAGDIVLYDQAKPFKMDFIGNMRGLVVAVPRAEAVARLLRVDDLIARKISGSSQAGKFTGSILSLFTPKDDGGHADLSLTMESSSLDLIFGSIDHFFDDNDLGAQGSRQLVKLQEIKTYLRNNLSDTGLTIDTICAANGVSPRTLSRLFSPENTSPMRWLWKTRLDVAHQAILHNRGRSISDIAYDVGFADVSHFSRAFKQAFGRSPSSVLRLRST